LLKKVKARSAMTAKPVAIDPGMSLSAASALMLSNRLDGLPVIDGGRLTGVIARLDLARIPEKEWPAQYVGNVMTTKIVTGYADETVYQCLRRMNAHNISHLPIVDREDESKLVGMLAMANISFCYDSPAEGSGK
jgi:CIC family chloride channel protein